MPVFPESEEAFQEEEDPVERSCQSCPAGNMSNIWEHAGVVESVSRGQEYIFNGGVEFNLLFDVREVSLVRELLYRCISGIGNRYQVESTDVMVLFMLANSYKVSIWMLIFS